MGDQDKIVEDGFREVRRDMVQVRFERGAGVVDKIRGQRKDAFLNYGYDKVIHLKK